MGGELARAAYAASFRLDELGDTLTMQERAVLLYMCTVAHDIDTPPRYWAGRDAIARYALGRREDDNPRSTHEIVRRALDGLVKRGAISRLGTAYPGRSQEYQITPHLAHIHPDKKQHQIGPLATPDWPISNTTLQMGQRHVGPETKKTKTKLKNQDHYTQSPRVQPVDNPRKEAQNVA